MTSLLIFAVILGIIGIIGSIVPGLPGPPVSWIGQLLVFIAAPAGCTLTATALLIWLAVTIVVSVLDYVIPAKLVRATGGSKSGSWGAIIGLFAGMFLTPIGMVAGSFLGAFIAELVVEDRDAGAALKSAAGSFLGFIVGTGLKLIASIMMAWSIIFNIF